MPRLLALVRSVCIVQTSGPARHRVGSSIPRNSLVMPRHNTQRSAEYALFAPNKAYRLPFALLWRKILALLRCNGANLLHCRSPFCLCLEHVDNLGAYTHPVRRPVFSYHLVRTLDLTLGLSASEFSLTPPTTLTTLSQTQGGGYGGKFTQRNRNEDLRQA
jgi:hypothetical protein